MVEAFLIISAGVLWGIGPIFDKTALHYFSSENTIVMRVFVAAIVFAIFSLYLGMYKNIPSEFTFKGFAAVAASAIAGFGALYIFYKVISMPNVKVATAYAIALAICPIVTAILAHIFYGESLFKFAKFSGIILIAVGIFLVAKE